MSILRIVSRYAKSLFDLAIQDNNLDQAHDDVMMAWEVAKQKDFEAFLKSPIISVEKKKAVIDKVFAASQASMRNTLHVMIEHKREAYMSDFCREFHLMYNKRNKISSAQLITAAPMSEAIVQDLLAVFKKKGLLEQQVELVEKVDPTILGGFILEFDGQVYNASLTNKLEAMKKQFSENLYTKNI
ncbi:MAG: ATP synthase F1 subunit delta [Aureispira sp.]